MFEATGDIRMLDAAVTIADNMLAMRNNATTGRVRKPRSADTLTTQIMWTGQRELTWPTKPANASNAGYTGVESGDVRRVPCVHLLTLADDRSHR